VVGIQKICFYMRYPPQAYMPPRAYLVVDLQHSTPHAMRVCWILGHHMADGHAIRLFDNEFVSRTDRS